jgi:hypothetical protein
VVLKGWGDRGEGRPLDEGKGGYRVDVLPNGLLIYIYYLEASERRVDLLVRDLEVCLYNLLLK